MKRPTQWFGWLLLAGMAALFVPARADDVGRSVPVSARALIVSQSRAAEDLLRKNHIPCDRRSILPDDFDQYAVVFLMDWSTIDENAPANLERYVAKGGGVVALGNVPRALCPPPLFSDTLKVPWMGIISMKNLFNLPVEVELPDSVLGEDVSRSPKVTLNANVVGVTAHQRGGEMLSSMKEQLFTTRYGAIYTYTSGDGRFFWQCTATSPVLLRTLIAGIRWAGREQLGTISEPPPPAQSPVPPAANRSVPETRQRPSSLPTFGPAPAAAAPRQLLRSVRAIPASVALRPGADTLVTYEFGPERPGFTLVSRIAYFASRDGTRLSPPIGPYPTQARSVLYGCGTCLASRRP